MESTVKDEDLRMAAVRVLERRGYRVTSTASGQGVPKFSRLEIDDGKERLSCAVKTTKDSGRISFARNDDGTYKVLSDSDRVIHVRLIPDDASKARISMFDRATVVEAFEANHRELARRGLGHIPLWVNPERESQWRMTGSGFQKEALWSETVSVAPPMIGGPMPPGPLPAGPKPSAPAAAGAAATLVPTQEAGIMDRIRAMLSEHLGVRPELIEIDVRVKL